MIYKDTFLYNCLPNKQAKFRQLIDVGRPYVWELRLSLQEFYTMEAAINQSISSHGGDYHHLLCEDFAVIVVMYLAEWYKRYYKGTDTMDDNKMLSLNTEELKRLYEHAKIDRNVFVYNASKNPDKTSFRWLESLQVLGGLAVQAEIKRDENDDKLLSQLCKLFHGEEIELDDLKDRDRAVAFQESIANKHSLYDYLDCILDKEKQMPFDSSDMRNEETLIPELIRRIESADREAKKEKFEFEWIVAYTASRNQMVRHLRVKLKPEVIGGGKKQYIGYDRLRLPEWGLENPENVGRIRFFLRFKNGGHYIKKEDKNDEPLFKYDNTGSEKTGFLSVNKIDENICTDIPVSRFDKVEMVMKYDMPQNDGTLKAKEKVVQELPVLDYMQVYALPKTSNKFSDRRNSQSATVAIFSSAYHLTEKYKDIPVVYAHYKNGESCSEDYCWCPINDKIIIADANEKEVLPPFFNRNGLYQVKTTQYLKTIKYMDNVYVLYKYIDTELDDDEMQTDNLTALFGKNALKVLHYPSGQAKDGVPLDDYTVEWYSNAAKRYVNWDEEHQPAQGKLRLRVTVKGLVFTPKVYYVPYSPPNPDQQPIWRDFKTMRICTALDGIEDIQDDFKKVLEGKEPDTKCLEIGNDKEKILVDVYRPILVRELSQKKTGTEESRVISYHETHEDIQIPLINCDQFSVRDFSESGVKEYFVKSRGTVYYNFPTFNHPGVDGTSYILEENASKLTPEVPLDYLKIYTTKALDKADDLYAWNYKSDPVKVDSSYFMSEEGIIFQSLKDNDSPRHYAMPYIKKGKSGWGGKKNVLIVNPLYCFETVAEHKTYFFLFNPLVKVISSGTQIKEILLPLMKKREYNLTNEDIENLYRFAMQFHFDWMLLPRETWRKQIAEVALSEEEKEQMTSAVIDFFCRTPKATDDRERNCLKDFVKRYWTYNVYPKVDGIAETALNLIMDKPDALKKIENLKDFLKLYDECRFKFIEMSKAINSTDNL
ncbi:MAG: hypothetical protein HUJ98_00310 [Bacteroidaceae bacterium]|nr:hypothetical protein [Bacteroidaceae bacterium]